MINPNVTLCTVIASIHGELYGAIQVFRNAFSQWIYPQPPPRNANNVEPHTFVTFFSGIDDTPTPHGIA